MNTMAMTTREFLPGRSYIPVSAHAYEELDPLLTLHREMNRLFDDVLRGSFPDPAVRPFGFGQAKTWPHIEVAKTGDEIRVMAELPGLDEKDVRIELSNKMLTIDGEKKSEIGEHNRWFNERYYGHFERRIPLDWEVDEDKVGASFRNGVLTVTLPRSTKAQEQTKLIPVHNGG